MDKMNYKITLVIPVYNSSNTITKLVDKCIDVFSSYQSLEIILVNDFSHDNSHKTCIDIYEKHSDIITYIELAKNFTEHNAVMCGLNYSNGDYIVTIDDDGQNDPIDAKRLVEEAIKNSYDVVFAKYNKKKHNLIRNLGSWFNGKVANIMLNKPKNLYLCTFRAISKELVSEIIKYDLPYPYVDGLILRTTSNIGTHSVNHNARTQGKSGYTISKLIRLWLNMFTNFSIFPLRAATILGFVFSIIGFLIGVLTIYEKIVDPTVPIGWASIVFICSLLGGIQLLAIGMIGEYLGRLFIGVNKQPQYVVASMKKREI